MKYKYLEHTADVLFEAYGKNLPELFTNAGLATEEIMVEFTSLKETEKKEIKVKGTSVEDLLFNFLEELIFLKDAELLLFKKFQITIEEKKEFTLKAVGVGEKINPKKQIMGRDVKAVTMHQFEVKKEKNKWKARVILDI